MKLLRQSTHPLAAEVTMVGDSAGQSGWKDFLRDEQLVALWDHDLLNLMSESPSPFSPTFTVAVRHRDEMVGAFVGSVRGVRPRSRPLPIEPLLIDMRMPGQAHQPSWHLRSNLTAAQRRSVIRAFERGVVGYFGRHRLTGIAYRNVTDLEIGTLERRGAITRGASGLGTIMKLPATYDDWLAGLSKKRRKSLRRLAPKIEEQTTIRFESGRNDIDAVAAAGLLNSMVDRNTPMRVDPRPCFPPSYLAALFAREDVRTITYEADGRLVAFGSLITHPHAPWGSFWAMLHPRDGGVPHLYFDHFMRYARWAIEQGAETLSSGRGYVDDKASVGFETTPLHFVGVTRPVLG